MGRQKIKSRTSNLSSDGFESNENKERKIAFPIKRSDLMRWL